MGFGLIAGPIVAIIGLLLQRRSLARPARVAGGVLTSLGLGAYPLFWPGLLLTIPLWTSLDV